MDDQGRAGFAVVVLQGDVTTSPSADSVEPGASICAAAHALGVYTSGVFFAAHPRRHSPSTNTSIRRSTLACQPGLSCV